MRDEVAQRLRAEQGGLEGIVAATAEAWISAHSVEPQFRYEVAQSGNELLKLSQGEDVFYDLPSIGFAYSLWYHLRRVNGLLESTAHIFEEASDSELEIYDLGAGTGALLWAVGIHFVIRRRLGFPIPRLRVINIDSSPFMLGYGEDLWGAFCAAYPEAEDLREVVEFRVNSWQNSRPNQLVNIWIFASYLFDRTERHDELGADFREIVRHFQPQGIFLSTSRGKEPHVDAVIRSLGGYRPFEEHGMPLFSGTQARVNAIRAQLQELLGGDQGNLEGDFRFTGEARWDPNWECRKRIRKSQQTLGFSYGRIDIANHRPAHRSEIRLNADQARAARVDGRPTKIYGPAGCGKSLVLVERVKNLVHPGYDPGLRILITTFNKHLIRQLGDWLEEVLEVGQVQRKPLQGAPEASEFYFGNHTTPSISLYHFDLLPTRIGGLTGGLKRPEVHKGLLYRQVERIRVANLLGPDDHRDILKVDFLLEEYHRIFYGLDIHSWDAYKTIVRQGRGKTIRYDSLERRLIFDAIIGYAQALTHPNSDSFISKRRKFLQKLRAVPYPYEQRFTHIFVDELQDCTDSDYAIFYQLLRDPNHIVVAGDFAQSINLGRSSSIPKDAGGTMANWTNHSLQGSYRLPLRISEALYGMSEVVAGMYQRRGNPDADTILRPIKGAPPGARVIIVHGESKAVLAEKVGLIHRYYGAYVLDSANVPVTIFEKDREFKGMLGQMGIPAEWASIRPYKGMEKSIVFWATWIDPGTTGELTEFIYTTLTRTRSILIVGFIDAYVPAFKPIIELLRMDRLIFWDAATLGFCGAAFQFGNPMVVEFDAEGEE